MLIFQFETVTFQIQVYQVSNILKRQFWNVKSPSGLHWSMKNLFSLHEFLPLMYKPVLNAGYSNMQFHRFQTADILKYSSYWFFSIGFDLILAEKSGNYDTGVKK